MRVLALDQSIARTGWAVVDIARVGFPARPVTWGAIVGGAKMLSERDKVDMIIRDVRTLVDEHRPDVLCWEKPTKFIGTGGGVTARTLILTRLDEALHGLSHELGVDHCTVAANSWRAKVLGKGAGRLPRAEAKQRAIQYCQWLGLGSLQEDVAEAVAIGMWCCLFGRALAC